MIGAPWSTPAEVLACVQPVDSIHHFYCFSNKRAAISNEATRAHLAVIIDSSQDAVIGHTFDTTWTMLSPRRSGSWCFLCPEDAFGISGEVITIATRSQW